MQPLLYSNPKDIVAFEIKNTSDVRSYIEQHDIDCEFRSVQICHTFWTDSLASTVKRSLCELRRESPEYFNQVEYIDSAKDLEEIKVQPGCKCAVKNHGAASLSPYKYVAWILRRLIRDGQLNLQTNTPVLSISEVRNNEETSESARFCLVTPRGNVHARNVLLASNAYTSHLLPEFSDLIVPVRETMTALRPPSGFSFILPYTYGFIGFGADPNPASTEYVIQRPLCDGGQLMLGGGRITAASMPHVGVSDDSIVDPAVVKFLQGCLARGINFGLEVPNEFDAEAAWSGIWAASRDDAPWVGAVPQHSPGLWICAAYSGHGMRNATLSAKAVVRMILAEGKGPTAVDAEIQSMLLSEDIPRSYLVTQERMEIARQLPDVEAQDKRQPKRGAEAN
jgi:glycine/D-amino acid oxidase-like deaminating enzyme